jgi:hypothetical protein
VTAAPIDETSAAKEITAFTTTRGITEVLHFTTSKGLIGVLASGAVACHDLLGDDDYLEHIYTPNCPDRLKDADWTGYVNLSISRVNGGMLGYSRRWHPVNDELYWVVLAFDPVILAEPGVWFTSTNNTYPVVQRAPGLAGLTAMFAPRVPYGYYGSAHTRRATDPDAWTTDPQAEVLYPGKLGTDRLVGIYVHEAEHLDAVKGLLHAVPGAPQVPVMHKPEVFQW